MCVTSMIVDHYYNKWNPSVPISTTPNPIEWVQITPQIPQTDIDEFYVLLERARKYDKENNQPDCELESKKLKLTELAKELGVDIEFPA